MVVLPVHGGLWGGGIGWRAVVVVLGLAVVVVVVVVVVVLVFGVVVLVVVVVVALVALVVVVGLVVVVVLGVCPLDPLALQRDLRVGIHLQPLGLQGPPDSGGGCGANFDGNSGRGVPLARVGLAGGGGGLRMPDGGALGDGVVDEGLDGIVLCSCLY